jgi:hypothetical protein
MHVPLTIDLVDMRGKTKKGTPPVEAPSGRCATRGCIVDCTSGSAAARFRVKKSRRFTPHSSARRTLRSITRSASERLSISSVIYRAQFTIGFFCEQVEAEPFGYS